MSAHHAAADSFGTEQEKDNRVLPTGKAVLGDVRSMSGEDAGVIRQDTTVHISSTDEESEREIRALSDADSTKELMK